MFAGNHFEAVAWTTMEPPSDSTGTVSFSECGLRAGAGVARELSAGTGVAARKIETNARLVRKITSRMDDMI